MGVVNHLLFIEPRRHYLLWGSCVMAEIVERMRKPEYVVRQLRGEEAMPEPINSAIAEIDPMLVYGVGHGSETVFTVECITRYMSVCDENTRRMSGRAVHLNSCKTAFSLGPDLINKGALTYFGSRGLFWLYIGSPPCSDRASRAVFLAEYAVEESLLAGKTTGEARADQLRRYDNEIEYWTTGEGRTHPHAAGIVRILTIDKDVSTMLGRDDVRVCTPPVIDLWLLIVMTVGMAPLIVVGGVISSEEFRKGWR